MSDGTLKTASATEQKRSKLTPAELLEYLVSKRNQVGCVQDPKGHSAILLLTENLNVGGTAISRMLNELASAGYIQLEMYKNRLFRIKVLKEAWDPNLVKTTPVAVAEQSGPAFIRRGKRTFLLLLDYENLSRNVGKDKPQEKLAKLNDFSWLLNPLIRKGKILLAYAFVTNNNAGLPPIMQLSRHGFFPIVCPRQMGIAVTKDKDTVDSKMDEMGRVLIEHSDATDLVIIAGDADFQSLATFARFHQKEVTIISATQAISGRFLEMQEAGQINLKLV